MRVLHRKLVSNKIPVDFFFFDPLENLILTACSDDSVRLWNMPNLKFQWEYSGFKTKYGHGMSGIVKLYKTSRFIKDFYVVAGSDGTVNIFQLVMS
jgi:WD40 repeat protein